MAESTSRRPILRFSVAALLFLMLCVGGYFAGYRNGFAHGKQKAVSSQLILRTYPVGDLIAPFGDLSAIKPAAADFDSLIDLIVATIAPSDWAANGLGQGEIQPFPTNLSLIISQTPINHAKVGNLLDELRRKQAAEGTPTERSAKVDERGSAR